MTRLEIAAPPTHHADSWHAHVRPRLHAFARLVARMRRDRTLRYRYLFAPRFGPEQRKHVLAEALPHLSDALGVRLEAS